MELQCLPCISRLRDFQNKQELNQIPQDVEEPEVASAVTLVPTWQQQVIGGQIVMACVTVPACMEHIEVRQPTAEERAVQGGRLLQGRVDLP